MLAGCLPGSCASSLIFQPDVGPETDARAQFLCPRRDVCLCRYAILTRRHQSPGLRRFAWRAGLGSGQPTLDKSRMIKRSFLPPVQPFADGVKVPAPRGRPMVSVGLSETSIPICRALYPVVACGRQPTAAMRDPCKAMHAVGVGREFFRDLAERYSHPPERKSGTVPHQLKMTNSPPTCKIAIFRRRSAAAETKDTQSEPWSHRSTGSASPRGVRPDRPAH